MALVRRVCYLLLAMAVIMTPILFSARTSTARSADKANKEAKPISFDELATTYRIIGRLGKPLGEFVTVRGMWEENKENVKFGSLTMRITHIDGRECDRNLVYHLRDVYSDTVKSVRPSHQDRWEIRGYETIEFTGTPKGYFEESRTAPGSGILPWTLSSRFIYVKRNLIQE